MSQFHPLSGAMKTNAVIDPEMIERELNRIATAHNSHAPCDFGPGVIPNTALVGASNKFVVPFGLRGHHHPGAVTYTDKLVVLGWPFDTAYLKGGYLHVAEFKTTSGLEQPVPIRLYLNNTLVSTVDINNDEMSADDLATVYDLGNLNQVLARADVLSVRAETNIAELTDLVFYLKIHAEHGS